MKAEVFLDTGIFVALLNRRDRWHQQALALFHGRQSRWATSALVLSEAYSWFLHRAGEETARSFLSLISELPDLLLLEATLERHARAVQVLDRLRGCKLTYVDASSLALLDELGIPEAWSTDRHLALTGARVLPRI